MDIMTLLILPACVGLLVGILSGLLGIGGGVILVPLYRLGFAMDAIVATGTSLFTIIPTSLSGAFSHIKQKSCIPWLGLACGIGGACMSPVGVYLATISPGWLVMLVAALIIAYSSINMLVKALKLPKSEKKGKKQAETAGAAEAAHAKSAAESVEGAKIADVIKAEVGAIEAENLQEMEALSEEEPEAVVSQASFKPTRKHFLIGCLIGLGAGLGSGYVGVGGGFIMIPLMLSFLHIPMKLASGTSLIAVMILAIPGVVEQGIFGNVEYLTGLSVALGSIPGAMIGARLVKLVPERTLRIFFGVFLCFGAIALVANEFMF